NRRRKQHLQQLQIVAVVVRHHHCARLGGKRDLISYLLGATEQDFIRPRESGAARGCGPSVHHCYMPAQLGRELHKWNSVLTAAEDDEWNRRGGCLPPKHLRAPAGALRSTRRSL